MEIITEGVVEVDLYSGSNTAYVVVVAFVLISILYFISTPVTSLRGLGIAHDTVTVLSLFWVNVGRAGVEGVP